MSFFSSKGQNNEIFNLTFVQVDINYHFGVAESAQNPMVYDENSNMSW